MQRTAFHDRPDNALPLINKPSVQVSVIVNYYEKQSTLIPVIERLLNQSMMLCTPDEMEIIVVDDGGEGGEVRSLLPNRVTYIWQRKMQYGIARAKNTGAKLANGRYLVFLDADILVAPTYVDAVLRAFDSVGRAGGAVRLHLGLSLQGRARPADRIRGVGDPGGLTGRFYQLAGGNMAIAKSVFLETPGFDEDLIYGGVEDLPVRISHQPAASHVDPVRSRHGLVARAAPAVAGARGRPHQLGGREDQVPGVLRSLHSPGLAMRHFTKVSVLVPTRRRSRYLQKLLTSFAATVGDAENAELVFRCDSDDPESISAFVRHRTGVSSARAGTGTKASLSSSTRWPPSPPATS